MEKSVAKALLKYEDQIGGKFRPDARFYQRVGINPKRFGQLLRGDKEILGFEARNLSTFFKVPLDHLC